MNRGQITGDHGAIDYDLVAPPTLGVAHAPITVREWNAHFGRHTTIYEGCMRFDEVRRLGAPATARLPEGAADPDLPVAMVGG